MYKLKSESDCVNWDICLPFIKSESLIMDENSMVVVDKLVEEVNKKLVEEYNDFFKFSSVRFKI